MLQSMRSSVSSWFVKILLGAIVASFILSYGFRGGKEMEQGIKARVNGHEITDRDVGMRFQSRLAAFRQFFQKDIPESLLMGLQTQILNQLIDEQLYARAAKQVGLVPSQNQVKDSIKKQFSDETGNFDFDRYKKIVQSVMGKSTGNYERDEATRLVADDFQNLVTRTGWVSDHELKGKFEDNNTKVVLSYIRLDADKLKGKIHLQSSPAELEAYYKAHQKKYEIPEKNRYEIAWVSMDNLAKPEDKDLQKTLREHFSNPDKAKGVHLHAAHILLKTTPENDTAQKKKLEAIRQKIANGESFEALATTMSEDGSRQQGGDLGFFGPGDMVPEFEKAAMALKVNQVSGLVKSSFGYHLIKLYEKIEPGESTVARLRPALVYLWKKKFFENAKKVDKLTKLAEVTLEDLKKQAGATKKFSEIKLANTGSLETPLLSKEDTIPGLPVARDSQLLLSSAANLELGKIGNPVRSLGVRHVYLVKKLESKPAQMQPFEKVQSLVKADFEKNKQQEALKKFAVDTLAKAVSSKTDLTALSRNLGLSVSHTEPFAKPTNGQIPGLGTNATVVDKVFYSKEVPMLLPEPVEINGEFFFVKLDSKTKLDWDQFEKSKNELRAFAAEEDSKARLEAWSTYLRSKADIQHSTM